VWVVLFAAVSGEFDEDRDVIIGIYTAGHEVLVF
jgi:hypothetical protein